MRLIIKSWSLDGMIHIYMSVAVDHCKRGQPHWIFFFSPEDRKVNMKHPLGWTKGKPFPPEEILDPPITRKGLFVGLCVFCGGSLGGSYQEDLYHRDCHTKAEIAYLQRVIDLA